MTDIWRYALRHDNGMAPCIDSGVLTLACCKPMIRKLAKPGDWVIGFVSRSLSKNAIKVAWVGRVTNKLTLGDFETNYSGRRDAIYRRTNYHLDGGEKLERLLRNNYHLGAESRDWKGINALIFDTYWYWGNNSDVCPPQSIADLAHPYVGQTKRGSTPENVCELECWVTSLGPCGAFGNPRDPKPF